MNKKKKTVFVGLSGGVDSAVSAMLLQQQGYNVVGVFIRTWHPDFLECNEEEERLDAIRVAAHLDIPFLTFDFEDIYKKEVADYMISEYKAGRTPNGDVMCNKYVKFGAFLDKALSMGVDFVATGHYARVAQVKSYKVHKVKSENQKLSTFDFTLSTGLDPSKDQAYFLWTLKQEQLKKILFPIGHLKKSDVRKLAKKFKLPVADKKDSQGICFLGPVDLKEFLKHYIKEKKGKVVLARQSLGDGGNEESETIGHHSGVTFYTLGERHGFTITEKTPEDKPYYIRGKDIKRNILIVSQNHQKSHSNILTNIGMKNINWISGIPNTNKKYIAQVRYHGELLSCVVKSADMNRAEIIFEKPVLVDAGQSVVIYDNEVCLGGGVVV